MNRMHFLKAGSLAGAATFLGTNTAFAKNLADNSIDKLVDANGNYIQPALSYSESFLEPYMDAETMHLHYTFHHGGAVKGANKDLQMIKKGLDDNNLETVDFWTKKLSYHFSSHILHSIFWTNLINKKTEPSGDLLKRIEKNFGSKERLKSLISETFKNVDGNGWHRGLSTLQR
ncbi:MAG: Manganese/iron superoxide dismutase [Ferruginibacter sp.]|uniref:superoxide dismutase n=1 Tax=Ferruginibacter sp. TaxID=1940288 RepID=UPI00265918B4|nr:hypothetical protein [Ferruginibacter sp.]MDB5275986.1 Manganese/iron superoxide dismutase [Ferruginibacter sp.]